MPKRDVALLLEDILAAIGKVERYTAGLGREAFLGDERTLDAVVRNLEIIGEAARKCPTTSPPPIRRFRGRELRDCATASCTTILVSISRSSGRSSRSIFPN